MIDFREWSKTHTDIVKLAKKMKSSKPEQYIGYYIKKATQLTIEYSKQFTWLDRSSFDIYIPDLAVVIEYDGEFWHSDRKDMDHHKDKLCIKNGLRLIRVMENVEVKQKRTMSYYPVRDYLNIGIAVNGVINMLNQLADTRYEVDVDVKRDQDEITAYVQDKFYQRTMAFNWPESLQYWDYALNKATPYDVFCTDQGVYHLVCPHCGRNFRYHARYYSGRRSFIPCECETACIRIASCATVDECLSKKNLPVFTMELESRRVYDYMQRNAKYEWSQMSAEEKQLYIDCGFLNEKGFPSR